MRYSISFARIEYIKYSINTMRCSVCGSNGFCEFCPTIPEEKYVYCVSDRNTTMGVFHSMADAVISVHLTAAAIGETAVLIMNTKYYVEIAYPHHLFTIVACRISEKPEKLFN